MKIIASIMGMALLLTCPATAFALGFEMFGNAPVGKQGNWPERVVDVVNLKTRVYAYIGDGQHIYFFRGGAPNVNEALRKFDAVRADARRLILLPGTGKTKSFDGKPVPFDWQVHLPGGRSSPGQAALTVYINGTKPQPLEAKPVEKWLAELNSESYPTRDRANRELQKLGNDAKPFLRVAHKSAATLEARRRIEAILARLLDLDVTDLELPKGMEIIGVYDQLAKGFKELKDSSDYSVRSRAAWDLSPLAPYSDEVVPALTELFKSEPDNHARRIAAVSLGSAGVRAKSALPVLKKGLADPDANVRLACQAALKQIESAKETPAEAEQLRREVAIAKDIHEFKSGKPSTP